jgi:hypothetical protein
MGDEHEKSMGRIEAQIEHIFSMMEKKASAESVDAIQKSLAGRATREWAIIMTGLGLVATIIIKSIGV